MTLTNAKINKCLREICKQVNTDIVDVNHGGCGVFAKELADILRALGISQFQFKVYSDEEYPVDLCKLEEGLVFIPSNIHSWYLMRVDFSHVRLRWNNIMWDVEGAVRTQKSWNGYAIHPGHVSYNVIAALARRQSNWNPYFDRSQIPKMRRIMYDIVHTLLGVTIKP